MATTNAQIIETYKALNNISCPIHTYAKWQELGYQVKKGQKSKHPITIWKSCKCKAKAKKDGEEVAEVNKLIMKTAYFFTIEQVEPIKVKS